VRWTFERKLRAAIEAPCGRMSARADTRVVAREGWFQRITPSAPGSHLNEVLRSVVDAADAERVIDEVVAEYRAIGKPTKWCTGPWTKPDDFGERLVRRGFTSWKTRGMGSETDAPIAPGAARVRLVETDGDLDAYLRISRLAWSIDDDDVEATRASYRPMLGSVLFPFIVDVDGSAAGGTSRTHDVDGSAAGGTSRTHDVDGSAAGGTSHTHDVGASALLLRDGYGYLVGGAIVEHARGRGLYRALVAARLAFLRDRGIEYAVTHARESTSAPLLEHFGFETLFHGACYLLDAPSAGGRP